MSPYRNRDTPVPAPVAPERRGWSVEGLFWVVVLGAVAIGVVTLISGRRPRSVRPCAELANTPASDLPARCTRTYDPEGGAP